MEESYDKENNGLLENESGASFMMHNNNDSFQLSSPMGKVSEDFLSQNFMHHQISDQNLVHKSFLPAAPYDTMMLPNGIGEGVGRDSTCLLENTHNNPTNRVKPTGIRAPTKSSSNLLTAQPNNTTAVSSSSATKLPSKVSTSTLNRLSSPKLPSTMSINMRTPSKRTNSPHGRANHLSPLNKTSSPKQPMLTAGSMSALTVKKNSASYNTALISALNIDTDASKVKKYYEECFEKLDLLVAQLPEKVKFGKLQRETILNFQTYTTSLRECLSEFKVKKPIFYNFCLVMESNLMREIEALKHVESTHRNLNDNYEANKTEIHILTAKYRESELEKLSIEQEFKRLLAHISEEKEILQSNYIAKEGGYAKLSDQYEALRAVNTANELKLAHLESMTDQANHANESYSQELNQLKRELDSKNEMILTTKIQLESVKKEHEIERLNTASLSQSLSTETAKRKKLADKNTKLTAELESYKNNSSIKDNDMNEFLRSFTESQRKLQERLEATDQAKTQLEIEKNRLSEQVSELRNASTDRVNSLEKQLIERNNAVDNLQANLHAITEECAGLKKANEQFQIKLDDLVVKTYEIEKLSSSEKEALGREIIKLETQYTGIQNEKAELAVMNKKLSSNIEDINAQNKSLVNEMSAVRENIGGTSEQQQLRLVMLTIENEKLKEDLKHISATQAEIIQLRLDNKLKDDRLFKLELLRRQLHNTIQDLKGKIRVYVRTRPALPNDTTSGTSSTSGTNGHLVSNTDTDSVSVVYNATKQQFGFDKVFSAYSGQEEVFAEVASFVQSALDGFNVCIFAYGQTGAGKTFTMQGSSHSADLKGIIPRAAELIVDTAHRLKTDGWEYTFEASYLEIYNETIRDLLLTHTAPNNNSTNNVCIIREDKNRMPYVAGLTAVGVQSVGEVIGIMQVAEKNRSTAVTDMNEHSSRSHSIFMLKISGTHAARSVSVAGALYLCDLAGSERLKKSHAVGDRLKETQAINKSLSSLSDIFYNLNLKNAHVPYRNSKLTHILQPCLSGSGKCSMVVALSPDYDSAHETLCSLRFASTVNQTELGHIKKSITTTTSTNLPSLATPQ